VHIRDDVITSDGKLNVLKVRPLARLGYFDYTTVDSMFTMPPGGRTSKRARPDWKGDRAAEQVPSSRSRS
jgi:hypothetical protein